jgi:hypothetical protein
VAAAAVQILLKAPGELVLEELRQILDKARFTPEAAAAAAAAT